MQQRFNDTLVAVSDGYFEWMLETDETFLSETLLDRLGYTVDEHPQPQALFGSQYAPFKLDLEGRNEANFSVERILPLATRTGDSLWMICKGQVMVDEQAASRKFSGILIDYSKQKVAENQLHQQTRDLERSNELLEQFAHIVSHDMKAPLRHIQAFASFVQTALDNKDLENATKEMQGVHQAAEGLSTLIDDIITFSRVNSAPRELLNVEFGEVVDEVLSTLAPQIEGKSARIECTELPLVRADRSMVKLLFQNLLSNALKYNDKETPTVAIEYAEETNTHVISVRDNGIGFDENYVHKIFMPFQRLVTRDEYEGSGIGLSICKTVVEQLGGELSASSEPGAGSCFTVRLPKTPAEPL